jgi:hypothetical protein
MAQIPYAVICYENKQPVLHLYLQRDEAADCAKAYQTLGIRALIADIRPPLPVARSEDRWGVYDENAQSLYITEAAVSCLAVQIRRAQPINRGIPQFVP